MNAERFPMSGPDGKNVRELELELNDFHDLNSGILFAVSSLSVCSHVTNMTDLSPILSSLLAPHKTHLSPSAYHPSKLRDDFLKEAYSIV